MPELLEADADAWRASFAADGLHPDRILLAQHAAEGLATNAYWDRGVTPETIEHATVRSPSATPSTSRSGTPLRNGSGRVTCLSKDR